MAACRPVRRSDGDTLAPLLSTSSNLTRRIVSAVALVGLVAAAALAGGAVFAILVAVAAAQGAVEYVRLIEPGARQWTHHWPVLLCGPAAAGATLVSGSAWGLGVVCLAAAAAAAVSAGRDAPARGRRVVGVVYLGTAATALVALRAGDGIGLLAVGFVFAVVWATDVGAYFTGRSLGGPRLAPTISPGKTWSGAFGGLVAGALAGAATALAEGAGPALQLAGLAIGVSIASQLGDMYESSLKRAAGVKDSGHLIPGHGGVLDRIDGLVFGSVAAFVVGLVRSGAAVPARGVVAW